MSYRAQWCANFSQWSLAVSLFPLDATSDFFFLSSFIFIRRWPVMPQCCLYIQFQYTSIWMSFQSSNQVLLSVVSILMALNAKLYLPSLHFIKKDALSYSICTVTSFIMNLAIYQNSFRACRNIGVKSEKTVGDRLVFISKRIRPLQLINTRPGWFPFCCTS